MHSRGAIFATVLATALSAGCATKQPPTRAEIQKQSSTLQHLDLASPWAAGAVTGPIADDWLASFGDSQLDALVAEAMTNNPDLHITATRVEIAAQYVELARAGMRPA